MSVRHDWYQTDSKVVVTVLLKNASDKNYSVKIERQSVRMTADGGYELELALQHPIIVENSAHKAYSTKVEITLAKESSVRWDSLEGKQSATNAPVGQTRKINWDSVAKEVERTEEQEAQGEEALQRLFRKIYTSSSPEVQKAMNKSFSESGGTVLSTNWNEVSKEKVDVKPPEGTEFRQWDK